MGDYIVLKLSVLVMSVMILMLGLITKRIIGTWNNPGSIFCLLWFLYIFIPAIMVFPAFVNPWAALYIFFFCFFFCLPAIFFNWRRFIRSGISAERCEQIFANKNLILFFILLSFLVLLMTYLALLDQDVSIGRIIEHGIVKVAAEYAQKRYTSELVESVWGSISILLIYPVVALGGAIWVFVRNRWLSGTILLLAFLPPLLIMLVQNAKGIIFVCIFLFWGSQLAVRNCMGDNQVFTRSFYMKILLLCSFLLPLIVLSFMSRGIGDLEDLGLIISRLYIFFVSYSSGHLYAFSEWFTDRYFYPSQVLEYQQQSFEVGFYTFMSFFQTLGDNRPLPVGVYDEFFEIPDVLESNLYTFFRGLIVDFGLAGSLVFSSLVGAIIFIAYKKIRSATHPYLYVSIYAFSIMFAYQTYIISSFTWKSIVLAILIFPAIVWFFDVRFTWRGTREKNMHGKH